MAHEALNLHRERREGGNVDRADEAQEHPAHEFVALRLERASPQELGDPVEQASAARGMRKPIRLPTRIRERARKATTRRRAPDPAATRG